jgi:hypothetical protein
MKNAKTAIAYLLACLGITALSFLPSCGDSELSKGEAKKIIEMYITKCYGLAVPANVILTSPPNNRYKHVKLARDFELVETTQTPGTSRPYAQDNFNVTLTAKGNANPYFEDVNKNICFLVSENKIDEIIEIKKDNSKQFTVFFSYTQRYNDLGKEVALEVKQLGLVWLENDSKLRGRITLIYDSFLKRYVIQDMLWSEWEKENWRTAIFVTNAKKDTAFYYSYERPEHVASTMQVPVVPNQINQEHSLQMERRNAERASRQQEQLRENEKRNEAMQKEREERQREIDRANLKRDVRQLEQQAEMERFNTEQASRRQEQLKETENRRAERELRKKLLR